MNETKYQLLCTFSNDKESYPILKNILNSFEIPYKKIFVYENMQNKLEIIYTYNISGSVCKNGFVKNTILVHRNKESNTIFTINALNNIIKEANNGILDRDFKINWENYNSMILIYTKNVLKKININLKNIINLN